MLGKIRVGTQYQEQWLTELRDCTGCKALGIIYMSYNITHEQKWVLKTSAWRCVLIHYYLHFKEIEAYSFKYIFTNSSWVFLTLVYMLRLYSDQIQSA